MGSSKRDRPRGDMPRAGRNCECLASGRPAPRGMFLQRAVRPLEDTERRADGLHRRHIEDAECLAAGETPGRRDGRDRCGPADDRGLAADATPAGHGDSITTPPASPGRGPPSRLSVVAASWPLPHAVRPQRTQAGTEPEAIWAVKRLTRTGHQRTESTAFRDSRALMTRVATP